MPFDDFFCIFHQQFLESHKWLFKQQIKYYMFIIFILHRYWYELNVELLSWQRRCSFSGPDRLWIVRKYIQETEHTFNIFFKCKGLNNRVRTLNKPCKWNRAQRQNSISFFNSNTFIFFYVVRWLLLASAGQCTESFNAITDCRLNCKNSVR